jgi:xanthine dehydrogenase accessory factor
MGDTERVLRTAGEWLAAGRMVCLATIIRREGSAPREAGSKMAICASGETAGSIGGGGLEREIIARAKGALEDGRVSIVDFNLGEQSPELDSVCGGKVSVLLEPLGNSRRLVVAGAGHVGKAAARLAHWVGFAVTLVDDREEFLKDDDLSQEILRVTASPAGVADLGITAATLVVICTRGHSLDKDWLRAVAPARPRYVGMLGSREKARKILAALEADGVGAEFLRAVRTPVGLEIGAETPEEIAVSIVGDLIMEWRGSPGDRR